jgi:hypothetical protein
MNNYLSLFSFHFDKTKIIWLKATSNKNNCKNIELINIIQCIEKYSWVENDSWIYKWIYKWITRIYTVLEKSLKLIFVLLLKITFLFNEYHLDFIKNDVISFTMNIVDSADVGILFSLSFYVFLILKLCTTKMCFGLFF